jgi:hypothetical protein
MEEITCHIIKVTSNQLQHTAQKKRASSCLSAAAQHLKKLPADPSLLTSAKGWGHGPHMYKALSLVPRTTKEGKKIWRADVGGSQFKTSPRGRKS